MAGKEAPGVRGMAQQAVRLQCLSYTQWRVEEPKCSCACWGGGCSQEAGDCLMQLLLPPSGAGAGFWLPRSFWGFSSLMDVGATWSGSVLQGGVKRLEFSDTGH